ncbi:MAG: Lrp/AsnC ligand binding domain-containing protein [Rikenellaceae bacterium]|nr:Lrp/AsnC ligand binding domain-containing protein [Rikenellaceae bacterium]
MSKVEMDAIDHKILRFLTQNARMPYLEIARECGVSGAAIHQRVKKLTDMGVIRGTRIEIAPKALGYDVCAIVSVATDESADYMETVEALKAIPEVASCHFITGQNNLLLKLYCRDHEHFMHTLMERVRHIKGVTSTETFISLYEAFSRQAQVEE